MSVQGRTRAALVVLAITFSSRALAQPARPAPSAQGSTPLAVVFEPSAAALPAAEIRAAIARQLNSAVVPGSDSSLAALRIATRDQGRTVVLRYAAHGELLERTLPWSAGADDALERIALLAHNLVQDQTGLLLDPPEAAPAPESARAPQQPQASAPTVTAKAKTAVPAEQLLPPSARPTVQLTVGLAFFNRVRLNRELQARDARGAAGLAARFEFPVGPNLALGLVVALEHWEGAIGVSPSDFQDVQLWARPRWLFGDLELSLPLGIGPSLMEELDASDTSYYLAHQDEIADEDAYPPELGLTASAQLEALYWFNGAVGVLLELGVEYHHATGREHDGLALTLNLVQPKAALGVALAF